jgi:hypothetical protein
MRRRMGRGIGEIYRESIPGMKGRWLIFSVKICQ